MPIINEIIENMPNITAFRYDPFLDNALSIIVTMDIKIPSKPPNPKSGARLPSVCLMLGELIKL